MERIKLLQPEAPERATKLLGGQASGIVNWNHLAYPQFYEVYKRMLISYWIPDEISMSKDIKQWPALSAKEQTAFQRIMGLLAVLDSVQTRFLLETGLYVSDPSVHAILAVMAQQEAVHNQSYSYVLSSLVHLEQQNKIFADARMDSHVLRRSKAVLDLYEAFRAQPTPENLSKALLGSIVLEGINFYAGFAFFYNLARQQKMVGTSTMISYIQRDEMQHSYFIAMLLRALLAENPALDRVGSFSAFCRTTIDQAVRAEIAWSEEVLRGIEGIELEEMASYIRYIANKRLRVLGLTDLYPDCDENAMPWICAYSDEKMNFVKTDTFEQRSRGYARVCADNQFDDL